MCVDFPDIDPNSSLVSSRRDLDASKLSRDVANPKKRMLGLTPSIFFRVDAPKTPKQVFGDPRKIFIYIYIYIYMVGAKDDKKKYHLFERYRITRESEKSRKHI